MSHGTMKYAMYIESTCLLFCFDGWAQDKEQRHTKQKQQHRKSKKMSNKDPTKKKNGGETRCS